MKVTEKISMLFKDREVLLSELSDNSFNIGIFDLEYGIGESSKNFESRNTIVTQKNGKKVKIPLMGYKSECWDSTVPNERIYAEIKRVTQDQIFFGANYYKEIIGIPQKPPRRNEYDKFLIDHPVGWIIWDKLNGNNDFNDCEIIYTSLDFHSHIIYYMWSGMMQGIYCGTDRDKANVQQGDKSLNVKRFHPTQKPVPIYKYLLTHFVKQDFKVLELGFGSASLAIACHDYEINLLTCENNLEYYKNGVNRFKFHSMLGKLIFPA